MQDRRSVLRSAAVAIGGPLLSPVASGQVAAPAPRLPLLLAPRLKPGDTLALVNPSGAIYENAPYAYAAEVIAALGFKLREAPNLRARRGHFAGSDAQRAADLNAMFADPSVHGILAMSGGSGANRVLPLLDYEAIRRSPKFLGGFSDVTALLNAVNARSGLVTFHGPMATSDWNEFSTASFRGTVIEARAMEFGSAPDKTDSLVPRERFATLRGGKARGPLVGGNLAVLSSLAGSPFWPSFDGAILFLEEVNEYIYRVDRMLSTLKNAGALQRLAGVVLGAFTNCTPGDGHYGTLTLDEVFDDYFGPLGVPVFRGAPIGHIRRKLTLPVGLPVEVDADAGTLRLLQPAVR